MDFNSIVEIEKNGFCGFKKISELWKNKKCIPKEMGVYMVINTNRKNTEFINPGVGGFFNGTDPNVPLSKLKSSYVPNAQVVYIGKAGGTGIKAKLCSRLSEYLRFGQTKNVGHKGGRYIWQIRDNAELRICWKIISDQEPVKVERDLIDEFTQQFGKMPYANLK